MMANRAANPCDRRFGLSECARMTVLKTAVALVAFAGAGLVTGDGGWFTLAAVLVSLSTLVVGLQVLLPGISAADDTNSSVTGHAR